MPRFTECAVHEEQIKELSRRVKDLEDEEKTNLAFRSKVMAWAFAASLFGSFLAFLVNVYYR